MILNLEKYMCGVTRPGVPNFRGAAFRCREMRLEDRVKTTFSVHMYLRGSCAKQLHCAISNDQRGNLNGNSFHIISLTTWVQVAEAHICFPKLDLLT